MRRITSLTAVGALTCACVAVAGCGTTVTGARREGPAPTATVKPRSTQAPAIASDPVALATMVRKDTSISARVRQALAPCDDDDYPVYTDSGDLTSGDGPDLVVNVMTCGDGLGLAAYVYRMIDGKYRNVFSDEHAGVYGSVDKGRLAVIHEVYRSDDPVAYPSGEEEDVYTWEGNRFVEVSRTYQDYSAKDPTASPEPTSTEPLPVPSSYPIDPGLPTDTASPAAVEPSSGSGAAARGGTAAPDGVATSTAPRGAR